MLRFSEPRGPAWQARKYSVGREGSALAQLPATAISKCGGKATLPPRRHCERSEAIQSLSAEAFLDCFAALAMTARVLKVFCPTAQAIFFFAKTTPCTVGRWLISKTKS
ncbi:hypothetical protein CDS [Bradyrhizobium sp.]|nr:hypothetical protein CDS [Bradyrhizobium sp.]